MQSATGKQSQPSGKNLDPKLLKMLESNWRSEMEGAATYRALAETESDARRKSVLLRLAEAEERHAARWARRLEELGGAVPGDAESIAPSSTVLEASRTEGLEGAISHLESDEARDIATYSEQAKATDDRPSQQILSDLVKEEQSHARILRSLTKEKLPEKPLESMPSALRERARTRLDRILGRERWHARTGSWLGDAIYGVNDGLGSVFGLVSGVAGATTAQTGATNIVLISGLAGMLASALSMGSGAYLAAKSEREVHDSEIARERQEMIENIDEEREELELFYQLKGFTPAEAHKIVEKLAQDPEEMLQALAQEELGITPERYPNPMVSALSAGLSTGVGAFIPIIPFFFLTGMVAIIVAAVISLAAHFAVGAAKSIVTTRSWWSSGMEMTIVGAIEGAVTFVLGSFFRIG